MLGSPGDSPRVVLELARHLRQRAASHLARWGAATLFALRTPVVRQVAGLTEWGPKPQGGRPFYLKAGTPQVVEPADADVAKFSNAGLRPN